MRLRQYFKFSKGVYLRLSRTAAVQLYGDREEIEYLDYNEGSESTYNNATFTLETERIRHSFDLVKEY